MSIHEGKTKATHYYVTCKDHTGQYKNFEVPKEVLMYVKHLECYIKLPELSKLKEVYPERFANHES